jgi:methyl-accepting chemotaxis protein
MYLQRLKIGARLKLGFGLLMALMIANAGAAVFLGGETRQAVFDLNRTAAVVSGLKNLLLNMRQARAVTWYFIASGDESALVDRDNAFKQVDSEYASLDKIVASGMDREMLSDAEKAGDVVRKDQENLIASKNKAVALSSAEFTAASERFKVSTNIYNDAINKLIDYNASVSERARSVADGRLDQSSFWSLLIGCLGVLFGGAGAWLISRSITSPIVAMTEAMGRIAGGELTLEVPSLTNKDETGAMAQAVQVFKNNGLKLQSSEVEAASHRQVAEQERAANEAARAEIQRQQEAVVASVAAGLDRLSKGDLTNRLNQAFAGEYEKLRADFNATADTLQEALRTISVAANGISTGSDQIAHASDDLSRRTEQQAASLEETAAALTIITATVKNMAAGAAEAAKVVVTTRGAAETSGEIVQKAVEAMGKIKESSEQITNIIGVIDEIAFQTNLLALNAGVEAARAGDAGRGFAVVASEVRALAQRSAEAAKEIKTLISASTIQVEGGVDLVDKTGAALKGIIAKVTEMDALVRQISASSQEQATGIAEINTAVSQMDQVVQQNAAMVEESTAAAHALKNETLDLSAMVGKFQIGSEPGVARAAAPRKPAAVAVRTAAPRAMKATGTSGGAPRSAVAEKDWDEF